MKYVKLRTKILTFFIIMHVILTALLTSITLYLYSDFLKTNTEKLYESSLSLIVDNINAYFNELREMTYITTYSSFSEKFLFSKVDSNNYNYHIDAEDFRMTLRNIEELYSDIKLIFLSETHDTVYHNLYDEFNLEYDFRKEDWYSFFQSSEKSEIVITDNMENYRIEKYNTKGENYAVIYEIKYHINSSVAGYMLVEMPKEVVTSLIHNEYVMCENILIYDQSLAQIVLEVKGSNPSWTNIIDSVEQMDYLDDTQNVASDIDGVTVYSILDSLDWLFVFNSSYEYLLYDFPLFLVTCILITSLVFACCVIITIRFTSLTIKPLEDLNQGFERVKKSDFQFKLKNVSKDEIGDLTNNFNLMVEKIDYFVNKVQYNNFLLKHAELKSLQAQINPHFLFNTLEMIIGMASVGSNDEVIYACELLGKIFKFNLGENNSLTIDEELEYVKNYVKITQMRFSGKFTVNYSIDESLSERRVTKFILQPFVENAIVHGFSDIVSGGEINIFIQQDDKYLIISVEDNGKGFSWRVLDNIYAQIDTFDPSMENQINLTSHIGILNVVLRLKLLFNNNVVFEITNLKKGSRITLKIPKYEEDSK